MILQVNTDCQIFVKKKNLALLIEKAYFYQVIRDLMMSKRPGKTNFPRWGQGGEEGSTKRKIIHTW